MIRDPKGNLYGTALGGTGEIGYGAIFAISPTGVERVLYSFTNGTDGTNPVGSLVRDAQGNLYGAAASGGQFVIYGTIFRLTADGKSQCCMPFRALRTVLIQQVASCGTQREISMVQRGAEDLAVALFSSLLLTAH